MPKTDPIPPNKKEKPTARATPPRSMNIPPINDRTNAAVGLSDKSSLAETQAREYLTHSIRCSWTIFVGYLGISAINMLSDTGFRWFGRFNADLSRRGCSLEFWK